MRNRYSAILMLFCFLLIAGCSGRDSRQPLAGTVQLTDEYSGSLPDPQSLPEVDRSASLLGPGWFEFQPLNKYYKIATWGASGQPEGGISVSGNGFTGWALFGIPGFDGDLSPTSVRVNADSVAGSYYVAFSSYADNRWLFAGPYAAGAEAEIPGTGNFTSPTAFISDSDAFYFAVIVEDGNSIEISTLEVGVHGGNNAPERPRNLRAAGGETVLELLWDPSISAGDYDFAGYILERAPLLFGSYVPLTEVPITDTWYIDEGVAENTKYRYRIASVDNAGNMSNYLNAEDIIGTLPASESDPVAVIDCPNGPFVAPVQVTFDLSRSFDPEGGNIDTYELRTIGIDPLISPSDSFTQTLQPGCYILEATVRVGARFGTAKKTVNVLPAWEGESVEIWDSFGDLPRMQFIRSWLSPDGNPVHIGYDPTIPIISVWSRNAGEFHFKPYSSAQGLTAGSPSFIGEPLDIGEAFIVPVYLGNTITITSINSETAQLVGLIPNVGTLGDESAVVLLDEGTIAVVFSVESGGVTDLYYLLSDGAFAPEMIAANVGMITALDAVFNPGSATTDIVYANGAKTEWLRFEPGNGVTDSFSFGAVDSKAVDIELDIATGRPAVVHYLDMAPLTARYQLLNDDNTTWGAAIDVDLSDTNTYPGDLLINDAGTFYFGGLTNGGNPLFKLYKLDGGMWSVRNSTDIVMSDATNINVIMDEVSADAYVSGYGKDGVTHMLSFAADGSVAEEWTLDTAAGFGRELHGTSGTDGLHVIFSQADTGLVSHMADTGGGWTHLGNPFGAVTDLDLASTSLGEVYASFIDVNSVELHYWDGGNWSIQQAYPGLAGYRPGLMDQPLQEVINWAVYLWPADVLRYVNGSQTVPFSFTAVTPADSPVWNCWVSSGDFLPVGECEVLAVAGDPDPRDSSIGYFLHGNTSMSELHYSIPFSGSPELWGRTLETCPFETLRQTRQAFWIPFGGENLNTLIIERYAYTWNEFQGPGIEFDSEIDLFSGDLRRTVGMAYARGGTAVALECDVTGQNPFLMWSNFGDWETIPLPDDLADGSAYMSMPELIVDDSGRWHIIYHDYYNDRMMVRSSI